MRDEKYTGASGRLLGANLAPTLAWLAAGCLLGTGPAMYGQATGVSVPQPVLSDSSETPPAPAKPSAAIPLNGGTSGDAPDARTVYGPYVPYHAADGTPAPDANTSKSFDPDANIVTQESIDRPRPLASSALPANDPDARLVTRVPTRPGEISEGTLVRVRLRETISTLTTQPGARFSADVVEPVMQNGQVYIPQGSVLEGRVTSLHGGKRIGGGASIHLEPEWVMLPDGTSYTMNARVIDTSSWQNTKVDEEGTIVRRDEMKGTVAAGGLTTGGAIAAGALIGGLPGALIGAGVGAGATAIVWARQDRQAELPKDLGIVFSLTAPLSVSASRTAVPTPAPTAHLPGE